tara:strand:+ start:1849 stop:3117 length:1269 start_codon:yes stop_codon:yes gene_type:complete
MTIDKNKIFFILMSIYPLSIVLGPSISLINTLLIITIYFLFSYKNKHFEFLQKNNTIKALFAIYIYLIINTLISLNHEIGLSRNLGFIRLIFLFVAINYFFHINKNNSKIFYIWNAIFIFFIFDVYIERLTGTNIFGWGAEEINGVRQPYGLRVMSFFKDEPIAGAYLYGFFFLISGNLLLLFKNIKKAKYLYLLLILCFLLSVIATGERSSTIKVIFGILLFTLLINTIKPKTKILIFTILFGTIILVILNSSYLKNRYIGQFYYYLSEQDSKNIKSSFYYQLYKSGFNVFLNSPLFGVGNKNYRIETCKSDLKKIEKFDYKCSTHPHQIYFEFLSEHGLVGTLILISLFFYLIFKNLKIIVLSQNYLQIGSFVYLLSVFLPLLPSGSFFSDFNITFFIINLSFLYAVNEKTNIFFVGKNN